MTEDTKWENITITFQDHTGFESVMDVTNKSIKEILEQYGEQQGDLLFKLELRAPIK